MNNHIKSLWLWAVTIAFSLYLVAAPVTMAAPALTVSENTTVSQNALPDTGLDLVQNAAPDTVSTADEFTAWLEAHKNSGGSVKLTDNIVLKEFYYFTPNGANLPDIIVDTDGCTITAAGNICLLSDGHLIFRGRTASEGMFHVKKGGILTLDGVIVEGTTEGTSPQYALWQEEGAGLILGNTYAPYKVSGEIHYAAMPFVTESASACVVVEKGQSADGLFPTQVRCNVNYQGQVRYSEMMPVSWNLAGTEGWQEKRVRFQVQGFSDRAVFEVPPVCTVVYNDYPLTFTEVDAFMRGKVHYFQGDYTKPQGVLPFIVAAEYSFDGTNWIENEKRTVSADGEGFCIYFSSDYWDQEQNPYIYIRLRGVKDDKTYLSNVLRYQAGNMGVTEDLGGSRGGGTSIVNPPDEPKNEDTNSTSSGNRKPSESHKSSDDREPAQDSLPQETETDGPGDEGNDTGAFDEASDRDPASGSNGNIAITDIPENPNGVNTTAHIASASTGSAKKSQGTDSAAVNIDENNDFGAAGAEEETVSKGTVEVMSQELAAPVADGDDGDVGRQQQMTIHQRLNNTRNIVLVSGFITLSAGVGVAGYFVHTSSMRRHRLNKKTSKKGSPKRNG